MPKILNVSQGVAGQDETYKIIARAKYRQDCIMPGFDGLPKTQAYAGLAKYLDFIKNVRPEEYKRIMDKPLPDAIADLKNSLESQIATQNDIVASGSRSSILPNWLPNAIRPASDLAEEAGDRNKLKMLTDARQGLAKFEDLNAKAPEVAQNIAPPSLNIKIVKPDAANPPSETPAASAVTPAADPVPASAPSPVTEATPSKAPLKYVDAASIADVAEKGAVLNIGSKGESWNKIQEAILKIDPDADIGSAKKDPNNSNRQIADGYGGPKTLAWLKAHGIAEPFDKNSIEKLNQQVAAATAKQNAGPALADLPVSTKNRNYAMIIPPVSEDKPAADPGAAPGPTPASKPAPVFADAPINDPLKQAGAGKMGRQNSGRTFAAPGGMNA